ncbi:MAG: acyl-protein synthetase [Puniceicoccaceae bacterium]|nr:MAG: acyl-protein synthetase [Puniceicoccaceae bacterium]
MKVTVPLKEMMVFEKIRLMEEIWSNLSSADAGYSPPNWHSRILDDRSRLAEAGEVGFTDWETAHKQIKDQVS